MQQVYSILAGSFAVRRYSTFCAALVGGYTFLQWPLRLLFDYASVLNTGKTLPLRHLHNASQVLSRFLAAVVSAWFSLEVFKYKAARKNPKQSAQDQQGYAANNTVLISQNAQSLDSNVSQACPPVLTSKTLDLTLFAVTRALDSLIVDVYRRSYPSFADTALVSSTFGAISRYGDGFIFALSSGAVVCLHVRAISSNLNHQPEFSSPF